MKVGVSRVLAILLGSVVFGVLMELRSEVSGTSMRALVAAAAGAILGLTIVFAMTRRAGRPDLD